MIICPWHHEAYQRLALRAGNLPHALLVHSAAGTGKRNFVQSLSQGLLCEMPVSPLVACGSCPACHWYVTGNHPDFRILQPEIAESGDDYEAADKKKKRDISIAQVRLLINFLSISTHRNGARVIVVQPAEAMNVSAANALLKSLEEPPSQTHFILVSDRPHMLPATLRSRCQQLPLRPPTISEGVQWLKASSLTNPELSLAQAGGAPLLAQELNNAEYWSTRQQFLDGLCSRSFDALSLAERFSAYPIPQIIKWLQCWSYDIASMSHAERLRYNPDRKDELLAMAKRVRKLDVLRFCRELVRFQRIVNHPLNARLLLEDLFLRYDQLIRPPHAD